MLIGKFFFSLVIVIAWAVATAILSASINGYGKRRGIAPTRYKIAIKTVNGFLIFTALILLLLVWGVDIRNIGILLSSLIGLVAIGFFAVWSILSNILAGFCLFLSDAFRIEDYVTILPENISGTVKDVKLLFVILEDEEGDVMHVPNNVLIQKVIKRKKRTAN